MCLLLLTAALLIEEAWNTGVTVDEPGHLVSSRLYWQHADRLRPQDMPPLIKLVAGWAPLRMNLPLPADLGKPGEDRREWEVSLTMMERLDPHKIQRVFFFSRLPLIVFPLLSTALIWWWGRQLFPPPVAIALACAFALEPTALAHGALFKNDHAALFTHLLFWFAAWRYWRRPALTAALLIAAAAALAVLSKLSLLFVIPLMPVLIIAGDRKRRSALWAAAGMALCYAIFVAAYQFDARPMTQAELDEIVAAQYVPRWFAAAAGMLWWLPVSPKIWTGMVTLLSNVSFAVPVYLWGKVWPQGNPYYFAAALAVKVPVSIWILMAAGVAAMAARIRRLNWEDALWLLPGFLYIGLASRVPLQLGVRLVLPALPFGLLLCGAAIEWLLRTHARQVVFAVLALVFLFESARVYPHGIAFFNLAAGGPEQGFRYLTDSNLDWGQGLGDLAAYQRSKHLPRIRLSYFGNDMVSRYFEPGQVEMIPPPWSASLVKSDRLVPEPGVWYAISPTVIPGQFFEPRFQDYYAAFRVLEPVARPGYAIFVYHMDASK